MLWCGVVRRAAVVVSCSLRVSPKGFGTFGSKINNFYKGRFRCFFFFELTYPMLTQMQRMGQTPAGVKTPAKIQNSIFATA